MASYSTSGNNGTIAATGNIPDAPTIRDVPILAINTYFHRHNSGHALPKRHYRGTTTAVFFMLHTVGGKHHRSRQGGGRVGYHKAVAVC